MRRKIERNYEFITESTCYGLTVSFKTAQDLHFSDTKVRFQIFINARLNQDNLKVYDRFIFKFIFYIISTM